MLPQHLVFSKLQESPHFRFSMRLNAFRDMLHLQFAQSAIDPFSQNQRLHPTPPSFFQCLTASSIAQCPQKTQHKECVVSLQLSPKAIHNILLPKNNNTILKESKYDDSSCFGGKFENGVIVIVEASNKTRIDSKRNGKIGKIALKSLKSLRMTERE